LLDGKAIEVNLGPLFHEQGCVRVVSICQFGQVISVACLGRTEAAKALSLQLVYAGH
jgi:hypothetical protein